MKVVIEFYRIRELDSAHAVLGRVVGDAIDTNAAIGMARSLFRTLDMPQEPDVVSINDDQGHELYCAEVGTVWKDMVSPELPLEHEGYER